MEEISSKFLIKSVLNTTAVGVIFYILNYLVNVVLTHNISAEDFGDYTVAFAWTMIWTNVTVLGARKTIPRFFTEYIQKGNIDKGTGLIMFYTAVCLVIGFSIAFITLVIWYFHFIHLHQAKDVPYHPLLLALFILPLMGFSKVASAVISSRKKFIWASLPEGLLLPVSYLIFFLLGKNFIKQPNSDFAVLMMFCSFLTVCFFWVWIIRKIGHIKLHYKHPKFEIKPWLQIGFPVMIQTMFSALQFQVSLVMIEILDKQEHMVGVFGAVFVLLQIYNYLTSSLSTVFSPLISSTMNLENKQEALVALHRKQRAFSIFIAITVGLFFILLAKPLLLSFGPIYIQAYWSLVAIVIAKSFTVIGISALANLQLHGRGKEIGYIYILIILLSIVLNFILIPLYGVTGAGLAMMISIIVNFFIRTIAAKKYLGLPII